MSVSKHAQIGARCEIASTAIVYPNVVLGDDCVVGDFCILGHPARGARAGTPLMVSDGAYIGAHSILYEGSIFGAALRVGHHSMIREGIIAAENLQVGSFNDLEGEAQIGSWVRFHSNVHLCRGSWVGDLVWIFPNAITTNDPIPPSGLCHGPRIGHGAAVCTGSVVLPRSIIGDGAFIGAMTRVGGEVPSGALVVGNPGQVVGSVRRLKDRETGKQHPWFGHHADAYPAAAQNRIRELLLQVGAACDSLEDKLNKI